jgi:hypothetical protein
MSSYYDNNLNKGEKIVIEAKHNKLAIVPGIIAIIIIAIAIIVGISIMSKVIADLSAAHGE